MEQTNGEAVPETWLKWAWVHGALTVAQFDSYADALSALEYAADDGLESWEGIEGPYGVVPREKIAADLAAARKVEWAKWASQAAEVPEVREVVEVLGPDGKHWATSSFDSVDEAQRILTSERYRVQQVDREGVVVQ